VCLCGECVCLCVGGVCVWHVCVQCVDRGLMGPGREHGIQKKLDQRSMVGKGFLKVVLLCVPALY